MTSRNNLTNLLLFGVIVLSVIGVSQFIGLQVLRSIPEYSSVEINRFIHFTHVRNHGGIFGMLQGQGWVFAGFSLLLLAGVTVYLYLAEHLPRYEYVCFGFIVGGGSSNVLDRLIHGSVIDFIDIQHIPYWNYIFNTADVMIHVGIWPLLFMSFFGHRFHKNAAP